MRHTTFRFALAPTPTQAAMLARHAGASRFAYNQCLRLVTDALAAQQAEPQVEVPWSGFDLINAFNAWKRSESAGRVFVAASGGTITKRVTGLGWRQEVCAQVFEEASACSIRVGVSHPRSVTLPSIGTVRVHDQTRQLRWLLRTVAHLDPGTGQPVAARARILFATVSRHGPRWYVSLNVQAPDLHTKRRHPPRSAGDDDGFVGVDRGLVAFAVAATANGTEVGRFAAPTPLQAGLVALRRR